MIPDRFRDRPTRFTLPKIKTTIFRLLRHYRNDDPHSWLPTTSMLARVPPYHLYPFLWSFETILNQTKVRNQKVDNCPSLFLKQNIEIEFPASSKSPDQQTHTRKSPSKKVDEDLNSGKLDKIGSTDNWCCLSFVRSSSFYKVPRCSKMMNRMIWVPHGSDRFHRTFSTRDTLVNWISCWIMD